MYNSLHVKYLLFLSDFNKTSIFWTFFLEKKILNVKFNRNPSSCSRIVPCGQADGWTYITKLGVAFRNFANAPKNALKRRRPVVIINA